ncbi:MAG: ATP synthase F1 subunit delta [Candidatus Ratteibacteria bacterium]|jgi:F-type H+-transporting ATPase subunit delta
MMKKRTLAKAYARTFYTFFSVDYASIKTVLLRINRFLEKYPGLTIFFDHPRIRLAEKQKMVLKIVGLDYTPELEELLFLLTEKRGLGILPEIIREMETIHRNRHGITPVTISSAHPLTPAEKETLLRRLTETVGEKFSADFAVREDLLAGLVIRVGDRTLNNSLKKYMRDIRENLLNPRVTQTTV